jgi:hypothetical protein
MEQLRNVISQSVSSIFTKQDVLDLIDKLAAQSQVSKPVLTVAQYRAISAQYEQSICDLGEKNQLFDLESAQFELNGCEISLSQVDIALDMFSTCLDDALELVFDVQ